MAVDTVREWWNKNYPDREVMSMRLNLSSDADITIEALNKGHCLITNYYGTYAYNKDRDDNWIVNKVKFWKPFYWHAVCLLKIDGRVHVKDNYYWRTTNIYELADIRALIKNGVFSENQYIYLPVEEVKKTKEQLKFEASLRILEKANSDLRKQADELWWYDKLKNIF